MLSVVGQLAMEAGGNPGNCSCVWVNLSSDQGESKEAAATEKKRHVYLTLPAAAGLFIFTGQICCIDLLIKLYLREHTSQKQQTIPLWWEEKDAFRLRIGTEILIFSRRFRDIRLKSFQ